MFQSIQALRIYFLYSAIKLLKFVTSAFKTPLPQILNQEVEVVYQNENYLVVNKPFDLLINSEETNKEVLSYCACAILSYIQKT